MRSGRSIFAPRTLPSVNQAIIHVVDQAEPLLKKQSEPPRWGRYLVGSGRESEIRGCLDYSPAVVGLLAKDARF